ncbi:MAG: ferredoxin [Clostridia bacterium]|nr:ferredoxin [Clostridia bacterium]
MRVYVDPDLCISCGACIDTCPEIFHWDEDGIAEAEVDEVPEELEDLAYEALDSCPTDAIIEDSEEEEKDDITLAMKKD